LFDFGQDVLGYVERGGISIGWTGKNVWVGKRPAIPGKKLDAVGFSPKMNTPVAAWIEDGTLQLVNVNTGAVTPLPMGVSSVMGYDGRIYAQAGDTLIEVILTDIAGTVVASPRVVANILPHATHMYDGCAVQNLLGSTFVSVFPQSCMHHQIRISELDRYKIVDARYDNRVLMVVGSKAGRYDRFVFEINDTFSGYALRPLVPDITPSGLNYVTLDNGVCVHITEEEKLEITALGSNKSKIVDSPTIGGDMRLVKHGGKVGFIRGNKVFSMRMK
jgi:hypothetical protein